MNSHRTNEMPILRYLFQVCPGWITRTRQDATFSAVSDLSGVALACDAVRRRLVYATRLLAFTESSEPHVALFSPARPPRAETTTNQYPLQQPVQNYLLAHDPIISSAATSEQLPSSSCGGSIAHQLHTCEHGVNSIHSAYPSS